MITTVFEYLAMLREVGPQEGFYKELQTTEETGFRWKEQVLLTIYDRWNRPSSFMP